MTLETKSRETEVAAEGARRIREERFNRLMGEARGLLAQNQVIFDRWRAEGILPPKQPGDRV